MNHQIEQLRARSAPTEVAFVRHLVEPGQLSRSAMLHRPVHARPSGLVQYKQQDSASTAAHDDSRHEDLHGLARQGISGAATTLPFLDQIQRSFGRHDVSTILAHVGGAATGACDAMAATAYATGNHVAFRDAPDLHTAAHEAAHVVQQRAGVQLRGGIGDAGDSYERSADQVADAVVAGRSVEALLAGTGGHSRLGAEPRSPIPGAPAATAGEVEPPSHAAATAEIVPGPATGNVQRKCSTCGTIGAGSASCPSCRDRASASASEGGAAAVEPGAAAVEPGGAVADAGRSRWRDVSSGISRAHSEAPLLLPAEHRARLKTGSSPEVVAMLGAGRALSAAERGMFPGWQGALGDVRIHDDDRTQMILGLLGDHGFAAGGHVALGGGMLDPHRLLAHEITHVVQQRNPGHARRSPDPESEADQVAERVVRGDAGATQIWPGAAPDGLAEKVIARYTHDLPGNLLLVLDVDDGDFIGGCVRANAPHVGAKLIKKGVPRGAGNQVFNIHIGVITNAKGEVCLFFYESVSGVCEMRCFPTWEEIKQRIGELRDWLKEKIEQVLRIILPVAIAGVVAYIIADLIIAALAAGGILAAA